MKGESVFKFYSPVGAVGSWQYQMFWPKRKRSPRYWPLRLRIIRRVSASAIPPTVLQRKCEVILKSFMSVFHESTILKTTLFSYETHNTFHGMIINPLRQHPMWHLSIPGPAVAEAVICCKHSPNHRTYNPRTKMGSLVVIYGIYLSSIHRKRWGVMVESRRKARHVVDALLTSNLKGRVWITLKWTQIETSKRICCKNSS